MRVFAWFLGFMGLALLAIGAFTYPAWTLLHPRFDFPFHRLGERIGMLAVLAGFVLTAQGWAWRTCAAWATESRVASSCATCWPGSPWESPCWQSWFAS